MRATVNDGIFRTMFDEQIIFLIIYSSPLFVSYQGDSGETGEPGLQGEVGPPVSNLIIFPQ